MQDRQKIFSEEILFFTDKISNKENFSIARFGDGEMKVIKGESIDLSKKCHGEHKYTANNENDETHRRILRASLVYRARNYFVGIACRCCVGDDNFLRLKKESGQPEFHLTWANVFVNSNYRIFLEKTVDALGGRQVSIVCHEKARPSLLPFPLKRRFAIGGNAWVQDYERLRRELTDHIQDNTTKDEVFLFCAGVLSNMLIYALAKQFPKNTYIDLGSVFDDMMGMGKTRKYLKGRKTLKKTCVW